MTLTSLLLQAAPNATQSLITNFVFIGGIILVFYFFMIRPQSQKQKAQQKFLSELTKGTMVITIGGVHGKIVELAENTLTLEVDKGTRLTIERSAVSMEATQKLNTEKK
ncbi:preprotein translocase subunit YajC [Eisenibacter elegans]|jgi:preprotein translocase subunit YajC|uniref:preprotein translocase subunit YajC n=1 Tax=Eisenibacter elegans TaxID=997 RepID=UPI0004274ABF|nr:preprotein translocase subunit YajC [Eisenibacter elegans]